MIGSSETNCTSVSYECATAIGTGWPTEKQFVLAALYFIVATFSLLDYWRHNLSVKSPLRLLAKTSNTFVFSILMFRGSDP